MDLQRFAAAVKRSTEGPHCSRCGVDLKRALTKLARAHGLAAILGALWVVVNEFHDEYEGVDGVVIEDLAEAIRDMDDASIHCALAADVALGLPTHCDGTRHQRKTESA